MKGIGGVVVLATLGLLLIVGGAWFIISDRRQTAEAQSWPTTEARIDASWIDVERGSRSNRRTRYVPKVNYSYFVGGRTYRNDFIWLTSTESFSSRNDAEILLRDYSSGARALVRYSPADPQRSALRIESKGAPMYILVAVGLALLGFAGWLYRRFRRTGAITG